MCWSHCEDTSSHACLVMQAFQQKIEDNGQHARGCNCKKSRCKKGYCECYQVGGRETHGKPWWWWAYHVQHCCRLACPVERPAAVVAAKTRTVTWLACRRTTTTMGSPGPVLRCRSQSRRRRCTLCVSCCVDMHAHPRRKPSARRHTPAHPQDIVQGTQQTPPRIHRAALTQPPWLVAD